VVAQRQDVEIVESFDGMTEIKPTEQIKQGTKVVVKGARGLAENDIIRTK
jgi:hypothetical protein